MSINCAVRLSLLCLKTEYRKDIQILKLKIVTLCGATAVVWVIPQTDINDLINMS